jgi:PKHD-type hydroxylase
VLLTIPDVLSAEQVATCRATLEAADWIDGRLTAGHQSGRVKRNMQLDGADAAAQRLGALILHALERSPRFMSAALPLRVFPPLFNRYAGGQSFGTHFDNAILQVPGTPHRLRGDLSATLFLGDPSDYDGGELVVQDSYGAHAVKLPAGHMVLYPASSLHRVNPVARGTRLAAFFWIQSMVRDDGRRTLLYDLDTAIQHVAAGLADHPAVVQLTGVYHNLLRGWADT